MMSESDNQPDKLEKPVQVSSNQGHILFGIGFVICMSVFALQIANGSDAAITYLVVLTAVLSALALLLVPISVAADADGLKAYYFISQSKQQIRWEDIHTIRIQQSRTMKICRVKHGSPEKTLNLIIQGPFEFDKADSRLEIITSQADLQFIGKVDHGVLLYRRKPDYS